MATTINHGQIAQVDDSGNVDIFYPKTFSKDVYVNSNKKTLETFLGNSDISGIGNGSMTGAISELNSKLSSLPFLHVSRSKFGGLILNSEESDTSSLEGSQITFRGKGGNTGQLINLDTYNNTFRVRGEFNGSSGVVHVFDESGIHSGGDMYTSSNVSLNGLKSSCDSISSRVSSLESKGVAKECNLNYTVNVSSGSMFCFSVNGVYILSIRAVLTGVSGTTPLFSNVTIDGVDLNKFSAFLGSLSTFGDEPTMTNSAVIERLGSSNAISVAIFGPLSSEYFGQVNIVKL